MLMVDRERTITLVNRGTEALFGYERTQLATGAHRSRPGIAKKRLDVTGVVVSKPLRNQLLQFAPEQLGWTRKP